MRLIILENHESVGFWTAKYITEKINSFSPSSQKKYFVLGLPTGSTPLPVYKNLITMYQKGEVSFKNVVTFNMDEYVGISKEHKESYWYFMHHNFFDHIDIKKENINILNTMNEDLGEEFLQKECDMFEEKIKKEGGVDLFLGGVGANGHIAFNEPGSSVLSKTRIVKLDTKTIESNARFFNNKTDLVPKKALSVGINTILSSKQVLILANGEKKKQAVKNAVLGEISSLSPVSFLKFHKDFILVCDEESASLIDIETKEYFKNLI